MVAEDIIELLRKRESPENKAGMARFGINVEQAFGVPVTELRKIAREIGKNHQLALELWSTGFHEAKIMAVLVAEPKKLDRETMESWARDFDSWDITDLSMIHLFRKNPEAHSLAVSWAGRQEEFVKRAGFALMATLAVHDKKSGDQFFKEYLALVEDASEDERNYVKKAVNWALRQIGKRNFHLREKAIETAERIALKNSRSARWIASDALRELKGEKVEEMLLKKEGIKKEGSSSRRQEL
ncbi:MAG: DNA alkylation repair protein [Bacillota bacterium]